jgi:hypothetical protein
MHQNNRNHLGTKTTIINNTDTNGYNGKFLL